MILFNCTNGFGVTADEIPSHSCDQIYITRQSVIFIVCYNCYYIYRAAPVVTVEADILAPREPLVLNDLPEENVCIVEGDTTVVCFNVSTCFNYSLLSGDSVEEFSKKHIQCMHMTQCCVTVQGSL